MKGSATFECVEKESRFSTQRADGSELVVESGKTYTTDDPDEIRELDRAPHAVRRVKEKGD